MDHILPFYACVTTAGCLSWQAPCMATAARAGWPASHRRLGWHGRVGCEPCTAGCGLAASGLGDSARAASQIRCGAGYYPSKGGHEPG